MRPALICVAPVPSQATTETQPSVPARSSGRSRSQVDYAALAGPRTYGSSDARARQVLDLRAAGCRETQEALSHSAGVASSTVSRLHARDQKGAPPTPIIHQIPLRLDDNSPTLMCTIDQFDFFGHVYHRSCGPSIRGGAGASFSLLLISFYTESLRFLSTFYGTSRRRVLANKARRGRSPAIFVCGFGRCVPCRFWLLKLWSHDHRRFQ